MPVNIPRLRKAFAVLAIAVVATVVLVYLYGRYRVSRALKDVPQKIGVNVQQSTAGFSLCRSEAGRTVFCINASKAVQYKQGGKAALKDVSIVVYGRQANRFDQIYGSDFEYDPASGEVSANGEVHIDLEAYAQGPVRPDQAPPAEIKNPLHLKTSGLSFNQKTGVAETRELIEFRVPQASGSAVGATYDAHAGVLKLLSKVRVTTGVQAPATITADSAEFTKQPGEAHLQSVHITQQARSVDASRVTIYFRDDDRVARVLAQGEVRATNRGPTTTVVSAPEAEILTDDSGRLRTASMTGGVAIEGSGASRLHGRAERFTMDFTGKNVLQAIHATGGVDFSQPPRPATARATAAQGVELATNAVDFSVRNGRTLDKATTPGPAEITLKPADSKGATTVVTAASFRAGFDPRGHLETLHGSPDAKIISTAPGQPQQVSTSRDLEIAFGAKGGIVGIVQTGDVHITDGQRTATAQQAVYEPAKSEVVLTGAPRVADPNFSASADSIRLDRSSGDVLGEGTVKTTYTEQRSGGAMPAASEPVHVTARSLVFHRNSDTARFSGEARLWQGADVVEAPVLDFDRRHRTVVARSNPAQPVTAAFVEQTKTENATPVNVTAAQLTYSDPEKKARFSGGVTIKGADATVTANQVDIFLLPKGEKSAASGPEAASQLDRIEATGGVKIRQPNRQAQGDKLVYVASEGKFELSGGPPSIFDAEHGTITGDSLTFYNRDDRVLIESSGKSRTVTQTRVKP